MTILKAEQWAELPKQVMGKAGFPIKVKDLKSLIYNPAFVFRQNVERVLALSRFPELAFRQGIAHQKVVPSELAFNSDYVPNPTQKEIWRRLDSGWPELQDSIKHLMRLQLVSMWTAFETLAGDLWEEAVNAHPKNLSELKGRLKKNAAVTEEHDTCDEKEDKKRPKEEWHAISLNSIQFHRFNIAQKMGTILRDEGRVKFDRLECIRDAYVRAFCKDHQSIRGAVYDHSLTALSIARNVIVHNGGICDELAEEQVKKNPGAASILSAIHAEKQIELNGEIMVAILVPAIDSCTKLIRAVDSWVRRHLDLQNEADAKAQTKRIAEAEAEIERLIQSSPKAKK